MQEQACPGMHITTHEQCLLNRLCSFLSVVELTVRREAVPNLLSRTIFSAIVILRTSTVYLPCTRSDYDNDYAPREIDNEYNVPDHQLSRFTDVHASKQAETVPASPLRNPDQTQEKLRNMTP
jgi:hypothetical protein